jgi:hypothetical protein
LITAPEIGVPVRVEIPQPPNSIPIYEPISFDLLAVRAMVAGNKPITVPEKNQNNTEHAIIPPQDVTVSRQKIKIAQMLEAPVQELNRPVRVVTAPPENWPKRKPALRMAIR